MPRQDSLTDQMVSVKKLAVEAGCYDAVDWLQTAFFEQGEMALRDWLLKTIGTASSTRSAQRTVERLVAEKLAENRVWADHTLGPPLAARTWPG